LFEGTLVWKKHGLTGRWTNIKSTTIRFILMVSPTRVRRGERCLDEERGGERGGLLRPLVMCLVGNVVAQLHLERGVEELAV